jgi:hypothetical protein
MLTAIRQRTVVKPGGVVSVACPELREGATAEVLVLVEAPRPARRSLAALIGAGKGGFSSTHEVDEFLRRDRESWES